MYRRKADLSSAFLTTQNRYGSHLETSMSAKGSEAANYSPPPSSKRLSSVQKRADCG